MSLRKQVQSVTVSVGQRVRVFPSDKDEGKMVKHRSKKVEDQKNLGKDREKSLNF